jgi:putative transposase
MVRRKDSDMSHYRRADSPGGCYFFTVVTYHRQRFFTQETARACLRHAWRTVQDRRPFDVVALCLLPEHLHCIWQLPPDDADFSSRWAGIKAIFTREYLHAGGRSDSRNPSHLRSQEAAIWQRRFWEHQIRDERDLSRHINYIHFNPVKHGLVTDPTDWPWSTYHRYLREGYYGRQSLLDRSDEFNDLGTGE